MTESNAEFIERVGAVCEAATAGPWTAHAAGNSFDGEKGVGQGQVNGCPRTWHAESYRHQNEPHRLTVREEDAHFIALARTALPEALKRLASTTADRDQWYAHAHMMESQRDDAQDKCDSLRAEVERLEAQVKAATDPVWPSDAP